MVNLHTHIYINTHIRTYIHKHMWIHLYTHTYIHTYIHTYMDPLSYFSFQPVLHDWCNKGRGVCYPVCGIVHIKAPLLLTEKSSPCGCTGFLLSLSEWSFTICPTPYNRKQNVLSVSLNKIFPSFLAADLRRGSHVTKRESDIPLLETFNSRTSNAVRKSK